ncbi:RidA family protein, partial [Bifidobacterium pseudocatenulatum]|nr:RidA family protein [Bifidobacterium pseudocatenulatum]
GQLGIDPGTGDLAGEPAGEQAAQALKNIKHILDAAGTGIEHVCRATIYIKNVEDFHEIDDVYAQTFTEPMK